MSGGERHPTKLCQRRGVEFFPVVEVVEVDGILRRGAVVWQAIGAEDGFAGSIIMDVTANAGIELLNGSFVHLGAILFDPGFELRVSRLAVFDEVDNGLAVETEAINDHLIIAFAGAWITGG